MLTFINMINTPSECFKARKRNLCLQHMNQDAVNLEIFARVLFSGNFTYRENKTLTLWHDHSGVY